MSSSLLIACDDQASRGDGPMTIGDMSASTGDMRTVVLPDMVSTHDLFGDLSPLSGQVVLTELLTTAVLPLADGGTMVAPVKVLSPIVSFSAGGGVNDYDDHALIGGCSANHWVVPTKVPRKDLDDGVVTISKFHGGMFPDGTTAPNQISCQLVSGFYACGYGPILGDGGIGPSGTQSPYAVTETPLVGGMAIQVTGAGGANLGAFDTGSVDVVAQGNVNIVDDLSTIKYLPGVVATPPSGKTVSYNCDDTADGGTCPQSVGAINIFVSQNMPGPNFENSTTYGTATCTGTGGAILVKTGAINAMFGCNAQGTGCDPALFATTAYVRTVALRFPFPTYKSDTAGNQILFVAGHGQLEYAPAK